MEDQRRRRGNRDRYDSSGAAAVGDVFQVNTYSHSNQVQWTSKAQDGLTSGVYAKRYDADGVALSNEFRVSDPASDFEYASKIAMTSTGDFAISWAGYGQDGSGSDVYAQRYKSSGVPVGSKFRVNTTTDNDQDLPDIALDSSGNFTVAWESLGQDGSYSGIYADRFSLNPSATASRGRVFGEGSIASSSGKGKATLQIGVGSDKRGKITGVLNFADKKSGVKATIRSFSSLSINGNVATVVGSGIVNGQKNQQITVLVTDNSSAGSGDAFSVQSGNYSASGILQSGNFAITMQ